MKILKDATADMDRKCEKILDRVRRGRGVRLTNQFDDGRLTTTFKPARGKDSHDCKVSVRISVYEGTALAAAAKQDRFASLTATGDAIAAAFAERLNQMGATSAFD